MTELEIRNSMDDKVDKAIKEDGQKICKVIYSAYKTNKNDVPIDNLHKIAKKGKIILISEADDFWGGKKSKDYRSEVLENPTWLQTCY